MSKVIQPSGELEAHGNAMKAWHLAVAEWLGLDPEKVWGFSVSRAPERPYPHSLYGAPPGLRVYWSSHDRIRPPRGHMVEWSADGFESPPQRHTTWHLDWPDEEALLEAVGPEPIAPWTEAGVRVKLARVEAAIEQMAVNMECEPDPTPVHVDVCPGCYRAAELRGLLS